MAYGCDGSDDGLEDAGDSVDDGHEACADGLEERLDLRVCISACSSYPISRRPE